MNTLSYIMDKFNLSYTDRTMMPLEIPNFGRDQLGGLFKELGFKIGAEIGVCNGTYSKILLEAHPDLQLYGIDPFTVYKEYTDYRRKSTVDAYHAKAENDLAPYKDRYTFIKKFSTDAVKDFEDNSLDFVYIDANHEFTYVADDIHLWSRKVRPGGIIAGHDYFKHRGPSLCHVYQVVNGYTSAYRIKPWFVLGTKAVIPGEIRDSGRSFMWVKT